MHTYMNIVLIRLSVITAVCYHTRTHDASYVNITVDKS